MEIKQNVSEYFIKLIRSTIKDEIPSEKPEDIEWRDVLKLAAYHKVDEMVFCAVEKLRNKPDQMILDKMYAQHEKNQLVNTIQLAEAEMILNEITAKGIDILPLKGYVLKSLYPDSNYRQMGDLDYLLEEENLSKAGQILQELGYTADDVGLEDSHDVYTKKPYLEVELHRRLLPPTEENHWYTDNIWERLHRNKENQHIMEMNWEDFYLYHLLHFEKHYSMDGCGIRSVIDQYYLMKCLEDRLDWDYINEMLPKMNYVEFESMSRGLAMAWFDDGEMKKEWEGPAEFIINSGAFGTFEQYQKWVMERYKREEGINTKAGFFFRRMFMERERMEFSYPILKKHGWMLPFLWIHRLFKAVIFRRGRVRRELKSLKK